MSDSRPIGIFDSGLGGLTVAKEIYKLLPNESTIYIGDTARVPYGNRGPETIIQFTQQSVNALIKLGVKSIVIACGTASSIALEHIRQTLPHIPIIGVIEAAAKQAVTSTKVGHIGIIGTKATINSNAFGKTIKKLKSKILVHNQSCPLFVPIIEEGIIDKNPILSNTIKYYLSDLKNTPIDTLILGCTHYPIIANQIHQFLPNVKLIDSGISVGQHLLELLISTNLIAPKNLSPTHTYYVTDLNSNFAKTAQIFLGDKLSIQKITL